MGLEEGVCQDCGNRASPGLLITESNIFGFNLNEPVSYCIYCNSYSANGKVFKNSQEIGDYLLQKKLLEDFKMNAPKGLIIKAKNIQITGHMTPP